MSADKRKAEEYPLENIKREKSEDSVLSDSEDKEKEQKAALPASPESNPTPTSEVTNPVDVNGDKTNSTVSTVKTQVDPKNPAGTLLISGGMNWDLTGRKELPKNSKGASSIARNLWTPHRLSSLDGIRVKLIVSGSTATHSVIVTESGQVMTWGRNEKYQLGLGDPNKRDVPTIVEEFENKNFTIVDAACSKSHTLFLTSEGAVYACGDNKAGQCGTGSNSMAMYKTPTKISYTGPPIVKVACGGEFSIILDNKGWMYSFGSPEYGQLGHNSDGKYFVSANKLGFASETVPKRIVAFIERSKEGYIAPVDGVDIVAIACGTNHTVAADSRKRAFSWGFGGYGRLGHAEQKDELVPRLIKFFAGPNRGVNKVFAGGAFSMAVNEVGGVYLWGKTKNTGEAAMYPKPVQDLSGWDIRSVACSNTAINMTADESVIAWGPHPTYGELGLGETKKSASIPTEVKALADIYVHKVASGVGHTLYLARDDTEEERALLSKLPAYTP